MASLKRKLLILAVLAVVLAVFFPVLKKKYKKHVKPHLDLASGIYIGAKNFSVFGVHVPWRYVLPGVILFLAVQLFRVSSFKVLMDLVVIQFQILLLQQPIARELEHNFVNSTHAIALAVLQYKFFLVSIS